ncbi:MAG: hypothetical protein WC967_03050 [Balneolaceae bacterium]
MQRLYFLLITLFIVSFGLSCSSAPKLPWINLIPENTSFVITPEEGTSITDFSTTEYANLLDDLTSSALQQVSSLIQDSTTNIHLQALAIYPATSTESQLLWIAKSTNSIDSWVKKFYEPLQQNYYNFSGLTIHKIVSSGTEIFIAQVNEWLVFSDSNIALEASLRSYFGHAPSMNFKTPPSSGQFILNTGNLDQWIQQFVAVANRPALNKVFKGAEATTLAFTESKDPENPSLQLQGTIGLNDEKKSALIDGFSLQNRPLELDKYIASNVAAFAVMRLDPHSIPIEPKDRQTQLDSLLINTPIEYASISRTLDSPFAFEAFPESGLLSSGEYVFLRKLKKPSELKARLNELADKGFILNQGSSYYVNSSVLAKLIGSEMCTFTDFYISFAGDVAAISRRKGLSESVDSDRARRRVIYYDNAYADARQNMPNEVSGFLWARSKELQKFLVPFLLPRNMSSSLFNQFDILAVTMQNLDERSFDFSLTTSTQKGSTQPYQELWVTPLNGHDLSGPPILGDIIGSSAKEIIYATSNGELSAIASDGTLVMSASTNGSKPIGSPILYDWYGNNQPVILLAAGSKIFGWNQSGALLPRFPIEMNATITAPIEVTDVLRNGIPEIIVATDDRKLHIIDRRGENINGWPQSLNAVITSKPLFTQVDGVYSIWSFSQNILHSWLRSGATRPGYPQFNNAGFNGSPIEYNNSILGAGVDGYIYSIGRNPSFDDSLSTSIRMDSVSIKSIYVTNNELLSLGKEENVLLKDDTQFYRSDLISTQSRNGSVFFYSPNGKLRLNQNFGQPASNTWHPTLIDINTDKNLDIVALADFGRLFAWDVLTKERIYDLPTSGMSYPLIVDLNGNGQLELIAQTREGLRCWTIFKAE